QILPHGRRVARGVYGRAEDVASQRGPTVCCAADAHVDHFASAGKLHRGKRPDKCFTVAGSLGRVAIENRADSIVGAPGPPVRRPAPTTLSALFSMATRPRLPATVK